MKRHSLYGQQVSLCNDCAAVILSSFDHAVLLHGGDALCHYCGSDQVCACDGCVHDAIDFIYEDIAA